ncbi:SDR family oxidoreductase [Brucella haematophila]|uniref:SDR family oxidoreductase n=1 Tax=Brucella haematophila TaxID=419474 RepID=UPI00110EB2C0|nr:SDR family oxidoreductase [Brucella haematophila]TMU95486.1 SDR family oxidoreductase [Brucella haematophila]
MTSEPKPSGRLSGKRAFVTAGAQGIGRAIAIRFAEEGAIVTVADLNGEKLAELTRFGVKTMSFDASDGAAVAAAFSEHRNLDILVNCVGWVHHGTILDADEAAWNQSFKLNVDPMYHAIRAALPDMLAAGKGSIVNIASAASSLKGFPNRAAYGTTKAAVIGLTKAVAADFVGRGIRCNAICPGTIASPSLEERINAFDDPVAAREAFISRQPMGRLGTPEEVAALATYLGSDESRFMTGGVVLIDGGATN